VKNKVRDWKANILIPEMGIARLNEATLQTKAAILER